MSNNAEVYLRQVKILESNQNELLNNDDNKRKDQGQKWKHEHDQYDISSISEGSIHDSPPLEGAKKHPSNGADRGNGLVAGLSSEVSLPPSPFPALSETLTSISNAVNDKFETDNIHKSPTAMQKTPASPAGSASSAGSPNTRSQQPLMTIPRFYDSEDDGPGSLVFIENQFTTAGVQGAPSISQLQSPTQQQPQQQQLFHVLGGSEKVAKHSKIVNDSGKDVPSLLSYPQRRKMAMGESSQEDDKKPPTAPKQISMAEKYKVPDIPLFRATNQSSKIEAKKEIDAALLSPQSSPEKAERKRQPSPGADRNRPPLAQSSANKRSSPQEVICPPPPPPPVSSPQDDSPDSGFHIRCNSQTSISSLGSNAVDSVKAEKYNRSNPLHIKMQPHGYSQMQMPNYYNGYMQKPLHVQQSQQQPLMSEQNSAEPGVVGFEGNVLNNVLGQDIAIFLHGERIAAQSNQKNLHHKQMPPQWNPHYRGMPMQQSHAYQHHIPQLNREPTPPPLTPVPNMELRRARLPSISDDDWAEELDNINQKNDGEYDYRMTQQQLLHQNVYHGQPQNPYSNLVGYYKHHPMQSHNQMVSPNYYQSIDGRRKSPHEKSSLLDRSYNRAYSSYNKSSRVHIGDETPIKRQKEDSDRRRKKKKSSRRREKSRLMQASESSEEEESERWSSTKSRKRSRRYRRKKREGALDDTLSDTMSESMMTQSLADHSITKAIMGGYCRRIVVSLKLLACNTPFSASAISLSIVLLGTLWFKWAEEILSSCKEVTFHSSQCNLPDFPGCYFCDEFNDVYRLVVHFRLACSYIGGVSSMLFLIKAILNWRSFIDEMSSPTTSSPAGLVFMTMAFAFSGKGDIGEMLVILASLLHLVLVVWFIYMSLAYQTMPDPSWFPNTIGIGICAGKVWFYYPLLGHFLIAVTIMLTMLYFPISLIRVAMSEKMSATASYLQMICPAICIHSLAIIMEPSFREERPDISHVQALQRSIYLPSLSFLFILCIVGMISSIHGIIIRRRQLSREEFCPAHAAYSFPLLMHALAVQSYRSGLDFFAGSAVHPFLQAALHVYFVFLMVVGTFVSVICIIMYIAFLPKWTIAIDSTSEIEPPSPEDTTMAESMTFGESLIQYYTSPPILQANETGVLLMAYNNEEDNFYLVRSRKILPALGFEPMMRIREFIRERDTLKSLTKHYVIHEGDEDNENTNSEVGL